MTISNGFAQRPDAERTRASEEDSRRGGIAATCGGRVETSVGMSRRSVVGFGSCAEGRVASRQSDGGWRGVDASANVGWRLSSSRVCLSQSASGVRVWAVGLSRDDDGPSWGRVGACGCNWSRQGACAGGASAAHSPGVIERGKQQQVWTARRGRDSLYYAEVGRVGGPC